jgi:hypothetical protein
MVYAFVGIGQARPEAIYKGEVCFKCRRVIKDARLAAESLGPTLPTKYRTPGCMAAYAATHPTTDTRYYVTDYVSGALIDATRAFFVPVLINDRTGEHDYRAYHSRGLADKAAAELGAGVVGWDTIVTRARAKV